MNYTFRDCRSKVNITGLLGDLGTNKQHCKLSQIQLFFRLCGIDNVTLRLWKFSDFCSRHTVGVAGDDIMFHILVCFLFVSHQSDNNSWDTAILKFDLQKSKVTVMGEVKDWGHIVNPISNQCTSFSFHINRTNHSWGMSNRVFDLQKTHPKFSKKNWQNTSFQQNSSKISSWNKHDQRDIAIMFCSDWLSGSHFILQTNKFLFMNAQPWPWVKITERSSSTFSQTCSFFVPHI